MNLPAKEREKGRVRQDVLAELADEISNVLEQAKALGLGAWAEELLAASDGAPLHARLVLQKLRKEIRENRARSRLGESASPAEVSVTREGCESLAHWLRARCWHVELYDHGLAAESIYEAVTKYRAARARVAERPRGRGKPSELTSPEAADFIREIAEIWQAYTGRSPHPGGGETRGQNFNRFLVQAFAAAGLTVGAYSLPRRVREALR